MRLRKMPTSHSAIQGVIERVMATPNAFSVVESDNAWPSSSTSADTKVHLAVLDSSFNPPTSAHQSIASSIFPRLGEDKVDGYTARLLLYSPKNAAKTPTGKDATPLQRLEMMSLLASSMRSASLRKESIATALIHAPNFSSKASILRSHLLSSLGPVRGKEAEMTFLVGMDTLVRIFDPKYYPTGEMHGILREFFEDSGARVVSARRGTSEADRVFEKDLLGRDDVKGWVGDGKVRVLGDGHDGWEDISSTLVREGVRRGDWSSVKKLVGDGVATYIQREGLFNGSD
ncbi:hypothetical protein L198_02985 [Cryptococcus wingfieldii CBS 7118]|uniref:Uncharacterized protein n=1 Tax=Cryptococcus wingfieldii CBS 7118 TaxID=1295528 RepID=A0A1E3JL53_9TREE|nr:hypothetical protein L198_02985 [Cryptococcus wingfieldii CBS 7118]ODO00662.1 hypothetical protein L198_02985 [Cryptococcus wingfieldii CBS 7118]